MGAPSWAAGAHRTDGPGVSISASFPCSTACMLPPLRRSPHPSLATANDRREKSFTTSMANQAPEPPVLQQQHVNVSPVRYVRKGFCLLVGLHALAPSLPWPLVSQAPTTSV